MTLQESAQRLKEYAGRIAGRIATGTVMAPKANVREEAEVHEKALRIRKHTESKEGGIDGERAIAYRRPDRHRIESV